MFNGYGGAGGYGGGSAYPDGMAQGAYGGGSAYPDGGAYGGGSGYVPPTYDGGVDNNVFGPGDPLHGYPKSIIVQRSGDDKPVAAKIDEVDLRGKLADFLQNDDDVGTASAGNQKLIATMKELARKAAEEAASKAATSAADKAARHAYLERATLIPPNENLSLIDINLVESFTRNPGTGAFLLLFMIFGYGGLVDEKSEAQKEKEKTAKQKEMTVDILKNAIQNKNKNMRVEQIFKYLNGQHDSKPAGKPKQGGGGRPAAGSEPDATDGQDGGDPNDGGDAGDDTIDAGEKIEEAEAQLTSMEISTPWHIAILPFAMLVVQFAYIAFIFQEAWSGYTGGTCPGYVAWTSTPGQISYPDGANAQARILMAFIAAFFCVRVLQQLLLFAHALEGQHTDGGLKAASGRTAWRFGFIPNFLTWASIRQSAQEMITNAKRNLPPRIAPAAETGPTEEKEDEFEKGVSAYLGAIHESIRNLNDLSYPKEKGQVEKLNEEVNELEIQFLKGGYISEKALLVVKAKAINRQNDNLKPAAERNPDVMGWRNIKWSWLLPFYIADCITQLLLLTCVFLVNLYIVFIDGVSARDMILNVVLLDFIYEQLPKFKLHVFKSDKAKALLRTLKIAHNDPPKGMLWKMQCRFAKSVGLQLILLVSGAAFLVSFAVIIYGPICKPGPNTAGQLPAAKGH